MSKKVTIIPARAGSKGIPNKNLTNLKGKPLVAYSIMASKKSCVDETWVSSEDDEILNISKAYGARAIKRPDALASDTASSESVLLHFAEQVDFDILVFLQPTSPMTIPEDINNGIKMMEQFDSVITVSESNQFHWSNEVPSYDINNRKRRQDCEQVYIETGAMFITSRISLLQTKNRISGKVGFLKVPRSRSFDIDTYEDLELVRKLMT